VEEVSDDWNRCCCAPYHPLRLEVRQYIPVPGDGSSSDWQHLGNDFKNDWGRFGGREQQEALKTLYMGQPPLLSILRDDGQRCCCKCPCKLLQTWVCFDSCRDGVHVYSGGLQDDPEGEKGRPSIGGVPSDRLIGSATQPLYGGWCTPTIELRTGNTPDTGTPFGKIEGPCCFGGWSELCFDFHFEVSNFTSEKKTGDLGLITKKKPQSMAGAVTELFSNADNYEIQFRENKLSAEQKLTVLAGQLLADYMFFDGNTEKCEDRDDAVICYCFYCSVIGNIIPCYIAIPKNK
jgi:hypothetical protein